MTNKQADFIVEMIFGSLGWAAFFIASYFIYEIF